jgi:glycosyltransferase involved in cell wall biosynthesis
MAHSALTASSRAGRGSRLALISIIVPFFNEEGFLRTVLERLRAVPFSIEREYILVDDGSWDGSAQIADELSQLGHVRVVHHSKRRGKGAAVMTGLALARGDYVVVQDADFEYDPHDLVELLVPLLSDQADAVYGSRFVSGRTSGQSRSHYIANRALTRASNALTGLRLTDAHTCYKLFRTDLLKAMRLRSRRFGFDIEVNAYIAKLPSMRLREVPISYVPRGRREGKKIGWRDGVVALVHLLRFNLVTRRASCFQALPTRYEV